MLGVNDSYTKIVGEKFFAANPFQVSGLLKHNVWYESQASKHLQEEITASMFLMERFPLTSLQQTQKNPQAIPTCPKQLYMMPYLHCCSVRKKKIPSTLGYKETCEMSPASPHCCAWELSGQSLGPNSVTLG